MQISLSDDKDFSIRHLSAVLLDHYIAKHWSDNSEKFQQPEVTLPIKQLIRGYLLKSLSISCDNSEQTTRKLLSSFAHSISKIAQFDWPSSWPDLFPILIEYLNSGSQTAIYSALKVFKELSNEVVDTQIPNVAPILLPHMLTIMSSNGYEYSLKSRRNAVKVFSSISETIIIMNEYQKDTIKLYLLPHIEQFCQYGITVLSMPDDSPQVDIALKKEIVTSLTVFIRKCRKVMKVYLPKVMEIIWQTLTTLAHIYVQRVVNSNTFLEGSDDIYSESVDSDGESTGFESYLYAIIDFVNAIFESPKYRLMIHPVLPELLYYILYYIQITDEQIESWKTNLYQFVEDDDIESNNYSIRIAAEDLILNLAKEMTSDKGEQPKKYDELFKLSFLSAIKRHFSEATDLEKRQKEANTATDEQTWWKTKESCLYSLGHLAPTVIVTIEQNNSLSNEYKAILDTIISHMNVAETFLAGRSILTASRFSSIMNDNYLDNFLKLTSSLLVMRDVPILRIFALQSTYYFCDNVQLNQKISVMKPYLNQFLQGLISIGVQSNSDLFFLVLQTIEMLIGLDKDFISANALSICQLATSAFVQYPDDPNIFSIALNLYEEIFKIEHFSRQVQEFLLPILVPVLNAQMEKLLEMGFINRDTLKNVNIVQLQPGALDILASMAKHSSVPMSEIMIQQYYPALLRCLQSSSKEDSSILQNGSECIRFYISNGVKQLKEYVDPVTSQDGLSMAITVSFLLSIVNQIHVFFYSFAIVCLVHKFQSHVRRT